MKPPDNVTHRLHIRDWYVENCGWLPQNYRQKPDVEVRQDEAVKEVATRSKIVVGYTLSGSSIPKEAAFDDWFSFADWLKNYNETGNSVTISRWTYRRISVENHTDHGRKD